MEKTVFETIQYRHRLVMFVTILDPMKSVTQIVHITLWIVFILCGFVTNGVFQFTLLRNVGIGNSLMNRLLMILSILEILILVNEFVYIAYPFFLDKFLQQQPTSHTPLVISCVWFYTLIEHFCSVLFVVVAYERYTAICFPLKNYASSDRYPLAKLVAMAFILSTLFTGIYAAVFYFCNITAVWAFYLLLFAPPLVPFITSGALYTRVIYIMFMKSPLGWLECKLPNNNARNIYRKRVVIVLFINTFVFFILNTLRKFFDSRIAQAFVKNDWDKSQDQQYAFIEKVWKWASYMTFCTVLNSTVNPVIYFMGSSQYRQALYQSCSCLRRCHANQHSSCPRSDDVTLNSISLNQERSVIAHGENPARGK
ncbi:hypothetical protein HOLleu_11904 [Holothuria leucospilota]|uniref:G-protein coupled receptors family 1 profile domain-containing protein n=1 Tax=Holothuria leucospilota TaxID=206669 RepID=A0A9Q1CAJ7_HOLLE|nr:hypothetical protein HOLleu_11904 [Holothuria leucospilota]